MKAITFSIQKGGTGKTSISVSVGVELAKMGKKVIIADCDPQGNSTGWIVKEAFEKEFSDYLLEKASLEEVIVETIQENLFILPTFSSGSSLLDFRHRAAEYPKAFEILNKQLDQKGFDYCIYDTSPAFDIFEQHLFISCDEVIPVLKLDRFSVDGMEIFSKNFNNTKRRYMIENEKPYCNRIVLNQLDERIKMHNSLINEFKNLYLSNFTISAIPTDQAFSKAQDSRIIIDDVKNVKTDTIETLKVIAEAL